MQLRQIHGAGDMLGWWWWWMEEVLEVVMVGSCKYLKWVKDFGGSGTINFGGCGAGAKA